MRTFRKFLEAQFVEPGLDDIYNLKIQIEHLEENPNLQNMKDFLTNWSKPFHTVRNEVVELSRTFWKWMRDQPPFGDYRDDYIRLSQLSSELYNIQNYRQINQATVENIEDLVRNITAESQHLNGFIDRFLWPERRHSLFNKLIQTLTSLEKYLNETIPLLENASGIAKRITY